MASIAERLNQALSPEFTVERELASGGMGIVFSAHDNTLDRQVAIKIIRPEQATERAAEKFLREARILANLRHPNVVPVHRAGEADGLFYYVMDFISETTLSERLSRGPLAKDEALKLGRDLLDALEPVHDLGVVHRDIKPSNVFLIGKRAVLADFGIARPTLDPAEITITDAAMYGTVGYMPPEQAFGRPVTARTDLYAVGMVLFEAYTGRRWSDTPPDAKPNWSGVPSSVVPILRRALAWEPERRWPDTATFRRALWRTRTQHYKRYKWYATAVAATTLLIGALLGRYVLRPRGPEYDMAIVPFATGPGVDSLVAKKLTTLTGYHLGDLFFIAPSNITNWSGDGYDASSPDAVALRQFEVQSAVFGTVIREGDEFAVVIEVLDRDGQRAHAGTVAIDTADLGQGAYGIGMYIARHIDPRRARKYVGSSVLSDQSNAAIRAFVDGELEFARNEWTTAMEQFRAATQLDSNFVLARWRFWNAWRWELTGDPLPDDFDLTSLFERESNRLPQRDSMIVAAMVAPTVARRHQIYHSALEKYPLHADVAHQFAEEIFNRGAFVGIPLDTAVQWLEAAVAKDSSYSPAVFSLLWASMRLGHERDAARWLERFGELTSGTRAAATLLPLVQFAYQQRFHGSDPLPESFTQPDARDLLSNWFRLAPTFGITQTQVRLGAFIATEPRLAANGHEGMALGLIALGRIEEALAHFDTAAAIFGTQAAVLEANEWRLIASRVGLPGIPVSDVESAIATLEQMVADTAVGVRATWALGIGAALSGDLLPASRRLEQVRTPHSDPTAHRLGVLLEAVLNSAHGELEDALRLSEQALEWDSAGGGGDPFASAVLHMERARWLDSLEHFAEADAARLWYEHTNIISGPTGEALSAEVDWALGTFATWLRGNTAAARGDDRSACKHLRRVVELWAYSDPPYAALRDSASTILNTLGCSP